MNAVHPDIEAAFAEFRRDFKQCFLFFGIAFWIATVVPLGLLIVLTL